MCTVNSFGRRSRDSETLCYISTKRGMREKRREERELESVSLREREKGVKISP